MVHSWLATALPSDRQSIEEKDMHIEEAITMALQYENRVVGVYEEAMRTTLDPTGKRVFEVLVREEQQHVAYLKAKLEEWKQTGKVTSGGLSTAVPSRERIEEGVRKLRDRVATEAKETEMRLLKRALDVEVETSRFYAGVVGELPPEGRPLFERFVEIENGHLAIVQAEMDVVSGLGYWFDMREFNLEGG
jgi:rubrerythrin